MEYAADEGRGWREEIQIWIERELGGSVFNPNVESDRILRTLCPGEDFRRMKQHDPERYRQIVTQLVDLDCREIAERSDFLVCYWDAGAMRGAGTKGELTMAKYFGRPVYMVTDIPEHDIPGWVLGCTTRIFPSFDRLREFLKTAAAPRSAPGGR
jgi:hypothetical protein